MIRIGLPSVFRNGIVIATLFLASGCQTSRPVPQSVEAIPEASPAELDREFKVVRDTEIEKYLQKLAERLRTPTEKIDRVRLSRSSDAFPFGVVRVSTGIFVALHALKGCRFENEVAALLALGLDRGHEQDAIERLYRSGIDPRGVIAISERQKADAQKIADARARIALYPPLRNPVVSTEAFTAMMRQLKQLR